MRLMIIPFVIDNQQHKMAAVLNDLLHHHEGHPLDIATATSTSMAANCCASSWTGWLQPSKYYRIKRAVRE
jgi:hypothetical protein